MFEPTMVTASPHAMRWTIVSRRRLKVSADPPEKDPDQRRGKAAKEDDNGGKPQLAAPTRGERRSREDKQRDDDQDQGAEHPLPIEAIHVCHSAIGRRRAPSG